MALKNAIKLATTSHAYVGGTGANSIDDDFNTSQTISFSIGEGESGSVTVTSTHTFSSAITLHRVIYKLAASATCSGPYSRSASYTYYVRYRTASGWTNVPGSYSSGNTDNGTVSGVSGVVTYDFATSIPGVLEVEAYAYAFSQNSGSGSGDGTARIYEVQAFYKVDSSYAGVV